MTTEGEKCTVCGRNDLVLKPANNFSGFNWPNCLMFTCSEHATHFMLCTGCICVHLARYTGWLPDELRASAKFYPGSCFLRGPEQTFDMPAKDWEALLNFLLARRDAEIKEEEDYLKAEAQLLLRFDAPTTAWILNTLGGTRSLDKTDHELLVGLAHTHHSRH